MRFMIWEAWLTLVVVGLCVALLASNRYPADIVMLSGVLTPEEALSGLANEGMVTVAVLYVVVPESFPLLGKSIREGRFRTLYQTASIAVARNGERIQRKTGVLTVLIAPLVWPF
jgi:di/tricarboxylate transporter